MKLQWARASRIRSFFSLVFLAGLGINLVFAQSGNGSRPPATSPCRVQPADYKGWHAQQISNRWVQLTVVPQNGGRLMQVVFAGHSYLFVNPKYEGKYLPPSSGEWFNYGGDKIWLLPEGTTTNTLGRRLGCDRRQPVFLSKGFGRATVRNRTYGPGRSPHRGPVRAHHPAGSRFAANLLSRQHEEHHRAQPGMVDAIGLAIRYERSNPASPGVRSGINHDFRTFTPANPSSSYLNRYHVRFGPAENRAASIRDDGLFTLRYVHMAAELWLDSTAGWLAVVDGTSRYGMVERFQFDESRAYPGKASIIFWTNGPAVKLSAEGMASMPADDDSSPYYLEAEVNSPLCRLRPGESCNLDTEWFPTRAGSEFHGVTEAGLVASPLRASRLESGKLKLSGSFGVFFTGRLVAHFYDEHGASLGSVPVANADPVELVTLETETAPPGQPGRVSLHLEDSNGLDRGSLGEVRVEPGEVH